MKKIIISFWLLGVLLVWAQGAALAQEKTFTNSLDMEFTLITAGSFTMGTPPDAGEAYADMSPAHTVTISQPFYLGTYEVTQEQWEAVMGDNPGNHKGQRYPVELVSWHDVQAFIKKLNQNESLGTYRLPTEAEWEYAARAGTSGMYFFGDDADDLDQYAWYAKNAAGATRPIGQKQPNAWGLYDMYGNVWEWVQDRYDAQYYTEKAQTDPQGPAKGSFRVMRGGCWNNTALSCQSAFRHYYSPDGRFACLGFRLVFTPDR